MHHVAHVPGIYLAPFYDCHGGETIQYLSTIMGSIVENFVFTMKNAQFPGC